MNNWSDIQIAYLVAKHGTLSRTAEVLGVHHSTVLRHIDAIEARLSCKLFHRHARGYTPTEAGQILLKEAEQTQERIERMVGKLNGQDESLSGQFIITSVSTFSPVIMPVIEAFKRQHPNVDVVFQADARIFKLEYGEAHVSIRPGAKPQDPDYVVQKLMTTETSLFASRSYLNRYGLVESLEQIEGHKFLNLTKKLNNISSIKWINEHVPEQQISFRGSGFDILADAALTGLGLAPLDCMIAEHKYGLVAAMPPPDEWQSSVWLVTHRDIHLSPKVRAFNAVLKSMLG